MNYTENYQLNQWESTDKVRREDFNEDNKKLDRTLAGKADSAEVAELAGQTAALAAAVAGKGNCQIIFGSYVGTGDVGEQAPTRLTFAGRPVLLAVQGGWRFLTIRGRQTAISMSSVNSDKYNKISWEERAVSWYCTEKFPECQCNKKDETYYYVALLMPEEGT